MHLLPSQLASLEGSPSSSKGTAAERIQSVDEVVRETRLLRGDEAVISMHIDGGERHELIVVALRKKRIRHIELLDEFRRGAERRNNSEMDVTDVIALLDLEAGSPSHTSDHPPFGDGALGEGASAWSAGGHDADSSPRPPTVPPSLMRTKAGELRQDAAATRCVRRRDLICLRFSLQFDTSAVPCTQLGQGVGEVARRRQHIHARGSSTSSDRSSSWAVLA